jgi:NADPH:quinone reductase-like Zn-dependent oxidoreductase
MKAIVQDRYGSIDELRLRDIDPPVPQEGQVLVRVRATSVHVDVWHAVTGVPFVLRLMGAGLRRPKNPIPGTDVAGTVESLGPDAGRFAPGEEVFGEIVRVNQWRNGGAFAELVAVDEDLLSPKPARFSFEEAAAVPTSAQIALRNLRDEGRLTAGQQVLINGAGGSVGTFAVQIAKAYGATVTAVDHTEKLDLLRSIGADRVIDYTEEDFTASGERWDLMLDVASNRPWSEIKGVISPQGTYVLVGHDHFGASGHRWIGSLGRFAWLLLKSPFDRRLAGLRGASTKNADLMDELLRRIDAGEIRPAVDRTFPLADAVEAIRYLESGRAKGKVILTA